MDIPNPEKEDVDKESTEEQTENCTFARSLSPDTIDTVVDAIESLAPFSPEMQKDICSELKEVVRDISAKMDAQSVDLPHGENNWSNLIQ